MTFLKLKNSLIPINEKERKFLSKIADGELVDVKAKSERNYQHHCKIWAIAQKVADNSDDHNVRNVMDMAMIKAGLIHSRIIDGENVYVRVKSLSYASMDQQQFEDAYNLIVDRLSEMSGISRYDLEDNWMDYFRGIPE